MPYSKAFERRQEVDKVYFEVADFFFLAAIWVMLIPGGSVGQISILRWATMGFAGLSVALAIALPILRRVRIDWLPRFIEQGVFPNLPLIERLNEVERRE